MRLHRRTSPLCEGLFLAASISAGLYAPHAGAQDAKAECVLAHEQAQAFRRDAHLRAAKKQLILCARDACPSLVKQDCGPWLSEVNEELPSVVVAAKDEHGADTATVEVRVDGELLAERLDGMPIDVDPGEHLFRFALPSGTALEKRVLVRAGDKGRELSVSFAPESAVRPPPLPRRQAGESSAGLGSHPRLTLPAIVLGSVGALALGSWGYFGLSGRSRQTQLEGSCQPNCPPSEIDDVRHRYLAADISLGVAVISLGVATFLTLSAPSPAVTAAAER